MDWKEWLPSMLIVATGILGSSVLAAWITAWYNRRTASEQTRVAERKVQVDASVAEIEASKVNILAHDSLTKMAEALGDLTGISSNVWKELVEGQQTHIKHQDERLKDQSIRIAVLEERSEFQDGRISELTVWVEECRHEKAELAERVQFLEEQLR